MNSDADGKTKRHGQHQDQVGSKRLVAPVKYDAVRQKALGRRLGNGRCHTPNGIQQCRSVVPTDHPGHHPGL